MNLYKAIEGCLSAKFDQNAKINDGKIMEIAI
jgi:hypothetical protein